MRFFGRRSDRGRRILQLGTGALALCLLLAGTSYAWIRRQWTPSVSGDNIRIEASGALTFQLDGTVQDSISVQDILRDPHFTLKPVSNCSGESEDFFTLDRSDAGNERFEHLYPAGEALTASAWQDLGKSNGYIEFSLLVLGQDHETDLEKKDHRKFVFLDPVSFLRTADMEAGMTDGARAIRISLTAKNRTVILVSDGNFDIVTDEESGEEISRSLNRQLYALNNVRKQGPEGPGFWRADGVPYWDESHAGERMSFVSEGENYPLRKQLTELYCLKDLDGGITRVQEGEESYDRVDPDKCLFSLGSNDRVTLKIRIWLEGEDPLCCEDRDIAGLGIDLLLAFSCVNCCGDSYRIIGE